MANENYQVANTREENDVQITMLNKLDVSKGVFNVKVRIIRLWEYMDFKAKGQVYSVEMVLMDEQGHKMLGSIINEHWQKFKELIKLNSTILITNAFLAENRATNKFMGNPNKVSFNDDTNIVEANDLGEPYGFSFASFEDMNNNVFLEFHTIEIPDDMLIKDSLDLVSDLINFVYPSILSKFREPHFFEEKALLAPTNEVVHEINDRLLSMFPGNEKEYLSSDSICQEEYLNENFDESLYSPEILNGLKLFGLPNHKLVLKVGVPVMLLRNLDQKGGLCNGTRLQVTSLGNRVIKADIISGTNIGEPVYIHRTSLIPTDKKVPLKFQRRQFPLAVCFAMTINKSQGQSMSRVGLFLKEPVFSHGQLYVALSRVKTRDELKLLIYNNNGNVTNKTKNVVYKEVFREL